MLQRAERCVAKFRPQHVFTAALVIFQYATLAVGGSSLFAANDFQGLNVAEREQRAGSEYQLGRAAFETGDFATAEPYFLRASQLGPRFPEPYYALATLCTKTNRPLEAQRYLALAVERMPAEDVAQVAAAQDVPLPEPPDSAAVILLQQLDHKLASFVEPPSEALQTAFTMVRRMIEALKESYWLVYALGQSPGSTDQHNARIFRVQLAETQSTLLALIDRPSNPDLWWRAGIHCFGQRREFFSATLAFRQSAAYSDAPIHRYAFYLIAHGSLHLGDWREHAWKRKRFLQLLEDSLEERIAPISSQQNRVFLAMEVPYLLLTAQVVETAPRLLMRSFQRQARLIAEETAKLQGAARPPRIEAQAYTRGGQLNVAILSGAPTGHVTYDLVGSMPSFLRHRHLNVMWYSSCSRPVVFDPNGTLGLKVEPRQLRQLVGVNAALSAQKLRDDAIGIVVDLDGWIGDEPPRGILSLRPAPVQAQWLGWAASTADIALDYIVADATIMPPLTRGVFSEVPLIMPSTYQLNDHARLYRHILEPLTPPAAPPTAPPTETTPTGDPVLKDPDRVTFANFNQLVKIDPTVFSVWANALRRTRNSQLLLLSGVASGRLEYPHSARNLLAEMQAHGISGGRLINGRALEKKEHLQRAAACAIAVDTLSYNSHTTGSDALWTGLPLVTLPGNSLSARVGASLTRSAGVPFTEVHSLKAYEDLLHRLATSEPEEGSLVSAVTALQRPAARASNEERFGTFSLAWDVAKYSRPSNAGRASPS